MEQKTMSILAKYFVLPGGTVSESQAKVSSALIRKWFGGYVPFEVQSKRSTEQAVSKQGNGFSLVSETNKRPEVPAVDDVIYLRFQGGGID